MWTSGHLNIWTLMFCNACWTILDRVILREWWMKFENLNIWTSKHFNIWASILNLDYLDLWTGVYLLWTFEQMNLWPLDMFCNVWQTLMEKAFPGDLLGVKDDGTAQSVPLAPSMMVIKMIQLAPTYVLRTLSHKIACDDGRQKDSTYASQTAINSVSWRTLGWW